MPDEIKGYASAQDAYDGLSPEDDEYDPHRDEFDDREFDDLDDDLAAFWDCR